MNLISVKTNLSVDKKYGINITQQMIDSYDYYLDRHRKSIKLAWEEFKKKLPVSEDSVKRMYYLLSIHDMSKYREEEYIPFLIRYYSSVYTDESEAEYNLYWKTHCEKNPHHWRCWNRDGRIYDIPTEFLVEIFLNMHSKSIDDPSQTAYRQFQEKKDSLILTDSTRKEAERLSQSFKNPLIVEKQNITDLLSQNLSSLIDTKLLDRKKIASSDLEENTESSEEENTESSEQNFANNPI